MTTAFSSDDQSHPLNNGHPSPFVDGGQRYSSVEQYMMAKKASLFPGNEDVHAEILSTVEYAAIKGLGRKVRHFDPHVWSAHAERIVERACTLKVEQNPAVMACLVTTGDAEIQQTNPDDPTWSAPGGNLLGVILMRVRSRVWSAALA